MLRRKVLRFSVCILLHCLQTLGSLIDDHWCKHGGCHLVDIRESKHLSQSICSLLGHLSDLTSEQKDMVETAIKEHTHLI